MTNRHKKVIRNQVVQIDLRISDRKDEAAHSPFTYVQNESILHNLQYALVWDSLRPGSEDKESTMATSPSSNKSLEPPDTWLSFSKVKKLARNYSFLMVMDTDLKVAELTNENKHEVEQGTPLILIRKEYVKMKLAIENKQQLIEDKVPEINEEMKQNESLGETQNQESSGSERLIPKRKAARNIQREDIDIVSSSDESENE